MIEDGETRRGGVTSVRRVGETIRRPRRYWTPAVHDLLRHLEAVGFDRAPRVLGGGEDSGITGGPAAAVSGEGVTVADAGEEVLSLLRGEPATAPWPDVLRSDEGVAALGQWLRSYHEAVRDFRPSADARWCDDAAVLRPDQVIRHGDLTPWNSIWRGRELAGFIDWDFAVPGEPLEDLAQLAWYCLPLRTPERRRRAGFPDDVPLTRRIGVLCSAYGADVGTTLDALARVQRRDAERITRLGRRGLHPWASFLRNGFVPDIEAERAWALEARPVLLGRRPA